CNVQTTGLVVRRERGTANALFTWITSQSRSASAMAQELWSTSFVVPASSEESGHSCFGYIQRTSAFTADSPLVYTVTSMSNRCSPSARLAMKSSVPPYAGGGTEMKGEAIKPTRTPHTLRVSSCRLIVRCGAEGMRRVSGCRCHRWVVEKNSYRLLLLRSGKSTSRK